MQALRSYLRLRPSQRYRLKWSASNHLLRCRNRNAHFWDRISHQRKLILKASKLFPGWSNVSMMTRPQHKIRESCRLGKSIGLFGEQEKALIKMILSCKEIPRGRGEMHTSKPRGEERCILPTQEKRIIEGRSYPLWKPGQDYSWFHWRLCSER